MNEMFDSKKFLVPVSLATGSMDSKESFLLLSYYGFGVITEKNEQYLSLETAIEFNRCEVEGSSGDERLFREELVSMFEAIDSYDFPLSYTPKILSLWAKVFPNQAKTLLKSQSKKIDPSVKDIIREAVN